MIAPRQVLPMLACGLLAQCACAPTGRVGVSQLLVSWSGPKEEIRLFLDGTAITTLRYRESAAREPLLAKTYRTSGKPARNQSARQALRQLSGIAPPQPKPGDVYSVARLYDGNRPLITIAFREHDLEPYPSGPERYPIWRGMYEEVRRCASCDLLTGLFYKHVAELYAKSDESEGAADYLHALRSLQEWAFRVNRESEYPGFVDFGLEVTPVAAALQVRRYHDAIERARKAWDILTGEVTVTVEGDVEVVAVRDIDVEYKELMDRAERGEDRKEGQKPL